MKLFFVKIFVFAIVFFMYGVIVRNVKETQTYIFCLYRTCIYIADSSRTIQHITLLQHSMFRLCLMIPMQSTRDDGTPRTLV